MSAWKPSAVPAGVAPEPTCSADTGGRRTRPVTTGRRRGPSTPGSPRRATTSSADRFRSRCRSGPGRATPASPSRATTAAAGSRSGRGTARAQGWAHFSWLHSRIWRIGLRESGLRRRTSAAADRFLCRSSRRLVAHRRLLVARPLTRRRLRSGPYNRDSFTQGSVDVRPPSVPAFVVAVLLSTVAAAENWPQWRGPGGQGVSARAAAPDRLAARAQPRLEGAGAPGHSSPVVWGDRIFLTAAIEGDVLPGSERRRAHDGRKAMDRIRTASRPIASTRSRCWRSTRRPGRRSGSRSRTKARSTTRGIARAASPDRPPATDGRMVFAYFGPEGLYAYDVDGKLAVEGDRAIPDARARHRAPRRCCIGIWSSSSATRTTARRSAIVAYDKRTGKEAWRTRSATCRSPGRRRCWSRPPAAPSW